MNPKTKFFSNFFFRFGFLVWFDTLPELDLEKYAQYQKFWIKRPNFEICSTVHYSKRGNWKNYIFFELTLTFIKVNPWIDLFWGWPSGKYFRLIFFFGWSKVWSFFWVDLIKVNAWVDLRVDPFFKLTGPNGANQSTHGTTNRVD